MEGGGQARPGLVTSTLAGIAPTSDPRGKEDMEKLGIDYVEGEE